MAAGDSITVLKPVFLIGDLYPTPAVFPALGLARTVPPVWPSGWTPNRGYANGVQLTFQNPKAAIQSSDLGILGYVGTGAHGQQLTVQFRRPTATILQKLASLYKVTKAAVPLSPGPPVVPAVPAAELFFQDANDELDANPSSEFRVAFEGQAVAGSLYATSKVVRYIGFRAQQGGNIAFRADHTGNDAGVFPTLTCQMLPYTVTSSEVTGTGISTTDIKDDKGMLQMIG